MRVVGSFIKTTPIHVMASELCLQPLNLRRRLLASTFWLKTKALQANTGGINLLAELSTLCNNSSGPPVSDRSPLSVEMCSV